MGNQFLDERIKMLNLEIDQLAKNVSDLQRDNVGLAQTVNVMSESMDALKQTIICLEHKIDTKTDKY
ncbi:hypothetical protein GH876_25330 [Bacillus thuringiensis]|uniref:hypothetical protein n=1 Tax=Bacillus cereus group TaxID=86661 RepID=UPI0012460370|nr:MULTISPECIES: hypothetical protein [Bacillus cereus group]MEB8858333.1 hypothetical protein [Bacillus cereus]KAB1365015.1 hypothetical protein FPG89_30070 [Bacillus thuringiensis]MDR5044272.1 hypothetical protein [Bacillus thuringiensis]MEB9435176.1 hypothetical protein [Bacillus cereus]MEB9480219.1 hypothetical protein [Bacillus cereus]